jgi:hypothetical protein
MDLHGKRVLLFGDSQMQGLGNHLPALLRAMGATDVGVSAHPGLSLKQAYLQHPRVSAGYDVVIVSFGGNNPPPTQEIANRYMNALLAQFGDREVAWITVLPAEDPTIQVARGRMERWQKTFLPGKGVVVLDGRKLADGIRRADGLHLTSAGYRVFAQRVARAIALSETSAPSIVPLGITLGLIAFTWLFYLRRARQERFRLVG